jgi:hypothetical protein
MSAPDWPAIPAGQIQAEVAADVRRLAAPRAIAASAAGNAATGTCQRCYAAQVAHPGADDITGRRCQRCLDWNARVTQLDRMAKYKLLAIVRQHAAERGASWVIGGPELWSKDELTADILRFEFPEVER